jgi:hypothetical protein
MAKISINDIGSGYASTTALNVSFNQIEDQFNNKVLYRDNPTGEPNQMLNDLDMNNYDLLNVGGLSATSLTVNGVDYLASMQTVYNNYTSITQSVTVSTASPSGGSDGDIWFKIT